MMITMEATQLARLIIAVHAAPTAPRLFALRVDPLIHAAARASGLKPRQVLMTSRKPRIAHARFAIMAVLREQTNWSTPRIAQRLGLTDHTSVLHGLARARELEQTCEHFADIIAAVRTAATTAAATRLAAEHRISA
jgi:chromosomal replication initiation ATPase DnaA